MKPPLPKLSRKAEKLVDHFSSLFTIDGKKGNEIITEGQKVIFGSIINRVYKRLQIVCSTQYGKSLWVALACIILTCLLKKVVVVVAPNGEKAKIIMRYYVQHLGDNPLFESTLERDSKLDRLRQEETKTRIMLNNGGGIFVVSTDERNYGKSMESAMGFGAEIVIMDEACLISDNSEATVFRMIAGKGPDAFYCKIGNPFYSESPNSHFFNSWKDIFTYKRIFIDYERALKEGRYPKEFIEQAKLKPLFDILFKCEFPSVMEVDKDGYRKLVSVESIKYGATLDNILAGIEREKKKHGRLLARPKLGCDVGAGGDLNVRTIRWRTMAAVTGTNQSNDTMTNVGEIKADMLKYSIAAEDVNIDDIGIGRGVCDRLKELGFQVNAVNAGETAETDRDKFANQKAEMCWKAKLWLEENGNILDERTEWDQLTWLKYKVMSDSRVQMEPKDKLKDRTKKSPDFAESFYLTFAEGDFIGFV